MRKVHYFVLDLPHSDGCFAKAYPGETTEAFLDGHGIGARLSGWSAPERPVRQYETRGGEDTGGRSIANAPGRFSELRSDYLFEDKFGRPSQGNDKGKVEGMVGYVRRNFLVPIPVVGEFRGAECRPEGAMHLTLMDARLRGHTETIGQRMERDLDALLPRPPVSYDACDKRASRVSSLSPGAVPHQRLLGARGLRTSGCADQRLRGPGGDQLRHRGHRPDTRAPTCRTTASSIPALPADVRPECPGLWTRPRTLAG